MNFKKINDYWIIYLIKEGNEFAIEYMFDKYEPFIRKTARTYSKSFEKIEDLVQEGRIILFGCIRGYSSEYNLTFSYYFALCLKRGFNSILKRSSYYMEDIRFEEDTFSTIDYSKSFLARTESLLSTEEERELYRFVILDEMSLSLYARKKHISYGRAYYKYKLMLKNLREKIKIEW